MKPGRLTAILARTMRTATGCREWQGHRDADGYGTTSWNGKTMFVHRVVWILVRGPIPRGLCVLHGCDNPPCCEPAHLRIGSQGANVRDMRQKGRGFTPVLRGERNGRARLSDADVAEVRAAIARGETQRAIATRLGCSQSQISRIARGERR